MPSRFGLPDDPGFGLPGDPKLPKTKKDEVDLTKRYDVYCMEGQRTVAYRNVLFKSERNLFASGFAYMKQFVELEQPDGTSVFIGSFHLIAFCEHGTTLVRETVV